jgi:hypothetical protein
MTRSNAIPRRLLPEPNPVPGRQQPQGAWLLPARTDLYEVARMRLAARARCHLQTAGRRAPVPAALASSSAKAATSSVTLALPGPLSSATFQAPLTHSRRRVATRWSAPSRRLKKRS